MVNKQISKFELNHIIFIEKIVTKAINGCRRSIKELYVFMPELFERGSRTNTILEPLLYESNQMR